MSNFFIFLVKGVTMNKQLANQGTSMYKNMTNIESLVLTDIESTNASLTYLQSNSASFTNFSVSNLIVPVYTDPAVPSNPVDGTFYIKKTGALYELTVYVNGGWH